MRKSVDSDLITLNGTFPLGKINLNFCRLSMHRDGVNVSCLNVLGKDAASMDEHRAMQRAIGAHSCFAVCGPEDLPHQLLACLAR
jgi:hypothetical protein